MTIQAFASADQLELNSESAEGFDDDSADLHDDGFEDDI